MVSDKICEVKDMVQTRLGWRIRDWGVLLGMMGALTCCSGPPLIPEETYYTTGGYKIGPEDVLEVVVWKDEDLSSEVLVRPDGKISLPLIGDLEVEGLTVAEVGEAIEARLAEFKKSPDVTVVVQEVNSYSVYVMGEVASPGRWQLKSYLTVLQVIALAGGFSEFAKTDKIFVLRKLPETGGEVRLDFDYGEVIEGKNPAQNVVLIPGDTIVVP